MQRLFPGFVCLVMVACGGGNNSADVTQDLASLSDLASDVQEVLVDQVSPTAPSQLKAERNGLTAVNLNWLGSTDNVGVAGYKVFDKNVEIGTSPVASFVHEGLIEDSNHCYTVKAFDQAGNVSNPSNEACVTLSTTTDVMEVLPDVPTDADSESEPETVFPKMWVYSWINLIGADAFAKFGLRVDDSDGSVIHGATVDLNGTNIPETVVDGTYALYGIAGITTGTTITVTINHASFGTIIATGVMPSADTLLTPADEAVIAGTTTSWDITWTIPPYTADSSTTGNQIAIANLTNLALAKFVSATTTSTTIEAGEVVAGEYNVTASAYKLIPLTNAAAESQVYVANTTNHSTITIN